MTLKSRLDKWGYKPDGSLKKNKKGIAVILALVLIPVLIGIIAAVQQGDNAEDEIYGEWQYYGEIPYTSDYRDSLNEADIITGQQFETEFGAEVPDNTITITEDGIKELQDIKGSRITSFEKSQESRDEWWMSVEITQLAGEAPLETPLREEYTLTLRGQYLFVHSQIDSDEYDFNEYADVYVR